MATSRLVELIDRYRTAHGVSESELARRIGVSRENVRKWRVNSVSRLPDRANLAAVARVIGRPYREVLSAALFDTGYLTDDQAAVARPYNEVLHDAIGVLTEASRLTNQPMRQSSSGQWEPDPDPRAALAIDWAAFVVDALAGAAANAGSVSKILSGRPGSWEAAKIEETLICAVGDDITDPQTLLSHRTEPVTVTLWVESILRDLDYDYDDAYDQAAIDLDEQASRVEQPASRGRGPFDPEDPRISDVDWISIDDDGWLVVNYRGATAMSAEEQQLLTDLYAESGRHWDGLPAAPGEAEYDARMAAFAQLEQDLKDQRDRELDAYAAELAAAITVRLAALGLVVPVSVSVTRAPEDATTYDSLDPGTPPDSHGWTTAIDAAVLAALEETPLPSRLPGTPLSRLDSPIRREAGLNPGRGQSPRK